MAVRVAVVGPRRRREGLGPFLLRYLLRHGAELVAVAASSDETARQAAREIRQQHGVAPRAYGSVGQMLNRERLDALVICSPTPLHLQHLQMAATVGLHVLCEKPLCFDGQHCPALAAKGTIDQLRQQHRVLMVNHPWPYTLSGFCQLYPRSLIRTAPARDVQVRLAPSCKGVEMIPHALTHALSLLQAVTAAEGRILHLDVRPRHDAAGEIRGWDIAFVYIHPRGLTVFRTQLVQEPRQPRRAGYAIDLQWVRRRIAWPQYELYLEPGHPEQAPAAWSPSAEAAHAVQLDDPLELLVQDFLHRCRQGGMSREDYKLVLTQLGILWMVWEAACAAVVRRREHPQMPAPHMPPLHSHDSGEVSPAGL